jgi:hypothetical protein
MFELFGWVGGPIALVVSIVRTKAFVEWARNLRINRLCRKGLTEAEAQQRVRVTIGTAVLDESSKS